MKNKLFFTLISFIVLFASCGKSSEEKQDEGLFSFSINTDLKTKTSSEYSLDNVTKLLITLKHNDQTLEDLDNKEIKLSNRGNGKYTSESISLIVGTGYQLTKFELQNSENKVIYATPYENSDLANQVSNPLPIEFGINKDRTSEINVEVLSTEAKDPSDFGYVSFNVIDKTSGNDPLIGNWIKSSSFPGSPRGAAVSFVIDDDAYVGTGYNGKDCLNTFYKYNLQQGWTKIANFPGTARREAVAFTANGKGYVGTGVDEDDNRQSDFWEYNPTTNTWIKVTSEFPGGARQSAIAFSINNIAYVGTGYGWQEGEDRNNLKDFYKFENGDWTKIDFDGEKSRNATTFVINKKAYVVSGDNSQKHVWEYAPSKVSSTSNGWTRKRNLDQDYNNEEAQRSEAISFVIDNKAYIATGKKGAYSREVWEYEPTKDEWTKKTSLEDEIPSREDAVAFSLNNRGFFTTGNASGNYLDDTWEFNPTMEETDDDN